MENDNKDKIIIALIIGIVLTLSYSFFNNEKNDDFVIEKESISFSNNEKDLVSIDKVKTNNNKADNSDIKVHISGQIKNPGVYDVKENDRLNDLVDMAGGLLEQADIDKINLALKLEDQMRIIIPNIKDRNLDDTNNNEENTGLAFVDTQNDSKKVNINTADQQTLMTLPNIGEKRALAIIEYRDKQKFKSIDEIKNVSGIGDKYFEAMKDMIVVN